MANAHQAAVDVTRDREPPGNVAGDAANLDREQQYRARFYGLLAGLLRGAPGQATLDEVARLAAVPGTESQMTLAMSMLGLAASTCEADSVADEYHDLFIGLGRGELVPYGSWYQTGFLMEKPLGHLRDDLAVLGYSRDEQVKEPEDHVAALCEVMMLMITDDVDTATQSRFFSAHLGGWIEQFFEDVTAARAAVFYRALGRLGLAFMGFERQYLAMQA